MFVVCFCQKPSAGWVTRPNKADVCVCVSLSLSPRRLVVLTFARVSGFGQIT